MDSSSILVSVSICASCITMSQHMLLRTNLDQIYFAAQPYQEGDQFLLHELAIYWRRSGFSLEKTMAKGSPPAGLQKPAGFCNGHRQSVEESFHDVR